jgi:hypothetical protein
MTDKTTRWALLRTFKADEDVKGEREEVVSIQEREVGSSAPIIRDTNGSYRVVRVPAGVRAGMVKGGPVDAVAGYGFRREGER